MSPESVGPYRVCARLGAGGMGEVFLAEDTRLRRKVALKSLSERWTREPKARRHLIQEARAVAALNHPNIAAVYDVLDLDDTSYIVMEYVPGESLATKLLDGPLPLPRTLEVGVQLCEALSAAHLQGILHRDLKPANLVLTPEGRLKVLDFGLAKSLRVDSFASADNGALDGASDRSIVVGTPAYIPPERYEGRDPTAKEDVYSAGVVLYELLSGRRPFAGADLVGLAAAVLDGKATPLRSLAPGVPAVVADVVERAMARRPEDRHPTAAALGADLERLLQIERLETEAAPGVRGRHRWKDGRRSMTIAVAGAIAVAAAGAAYRAWSGAREATEARAVPVVLVMPLANATGDAADEALGTGVADVLVSALSRVPRVNVLSLAAGQECARGPRDLRCAVGELGADYVLDGSVQRQADRVRVTLSLVNGSSRLVSWSESYDGALDDLFGFQHTVAEGVAGALRLRVPHDADAHERRLAIDERAFADYAQALSLLERRDEAASVDRAVALLEGVAALEPQFALAQAGLGRAHWIKYEETKAVDQAGRAEAALGRALQLDPELPGVLLVQASVLKTKGQLESAEAAARRALARQPENDEAHALLGAILAAQGRSDEGVAELRRAIVLRPNYWQHHQALGLAEFNRGSLEAAVEGFRRVVALRPESPWGHVNLGSAQYSQGDRAGARASFERAVALQPDADAYSNLGFLAYEERRFAQAVEAFKKAADLQPRDAGLQRNLGDALLRLGRKQDARSAYSKAVKLQAVEVGIRPNDGKALARLALYEAKMGGLESALKRAAAAEALAPESADAAYFVAVVRALAGHDEEGLAGVRRAIDLGYSREVARADDDLERLRSTPEFAALVATRVELR